MKKILIALILVPIALCLATGGVNIISGIISGDISVLAWIQDHRVILAFIACYIVLTFVGPFKK